MQGKPRHVKLENERSPLIKRKKGKSHSPTKNMPPPFTGMGSLVDQLNFKLF